MRGLQWPVRYPCTTRATSATNSLETRYGLGLDAAAFPDANVVMFSKVGNRLPSFFPVEV